MVKPNDMELDQLLARGRLSGRQYDDIARRVLQQVAPEPRRWAWLRTVPAAWVSAAALSAAGAALCAWLFLGIDTQRSRGSEVPAAGFRAKGTAQPGASAAEFDLGCSGATPHVCRLGDTLLFSLNAHAPSGYVVAYAERMGEPAQRIWYFPAQGVPREGSSAPHVQTQAGTSVLPQGVRLGPPHSAGRYRVTLWVSGVPLTREQAEAQLAEPHSTPERRTLELEIVN